MLPWWRNRIVADIYPRMIALRRRSRGPSSREAAPEKIEIVAGRDARDWRPALDRLSQLLEDQPWRTADLHVVLAGGLTRCLVLPWMNNLSGQDAQAYARCQFADIYGQQAAEAWEICISRAAPGAPRVAVAAERALLDELRAQATRLGLRLRSVRPTLSRAAGALPDGDALAGWLALVEQGHVCLARIQRGNFVSVRSAGFEEDPASTVLALLSQDALCGGVDQGFGKLYLAAQRVLDSSSLRSQGWQVLSLEMGAAHAL